VPALQGAADITAEQIEPNHAEKAAMGAGSQYHSIRDVEWDET
jgi:hypothetical protein